MVVISIILSVAILSFTNLTRDDGNTLLKSKIWDKMCTVMENTCQEQAFYDNDEVIGNFSISRKVTNYKGNEDLYLIELNALAPNGQSILQLNKLTYAKVEN